MSDLAWPLKQNRIRRDMRNHTFGMVRNGGNRPHQGWDLYAVPGTTTYAIADGMIKYSDYRGLFGNLIILEFEHKGETRFAAYAHLKCRSVKEGDIVKRGQVIGQTGNTGNANSMTGEDQHLHFEIRTIEMPGLGLSGRKDPAKLYDRTPIGFTVFENHSNQQAIQCS